MLRVHLDVRYMRVFTCLILFLVGKWPPERRCVAYNITYCTLLNNTHNGPVSDLCPFHIPEAIFNARTFKFDTNVVVNI